MASSGALFQKMGIVSTSSRLSCRAKAQHWNSLRLRRMRVQLVHRRSSSWHSRCACFFILEAVMFSVAWGSRMHHAFDARVDMDSKANGDETAHHYTNRGGSTSREASASNHSSAEVAPSRSNDNEVARHLLRELGVYRGAGAGRIDASFFATADTSTMGCFVGVDGERLGCQADCQCAWSEQCYPKKVVTSGNASLGISLLQAGTSVNVGVCGMSMHMMVASSAGIFVSVLAGLVSIRMFFQWRELLLDDDDTTARAKALLARAEAAAVESSSRRKLVTA